MCGLLCAGNSSERKRKRLENQAQVGCQEDLRNRKTENEKTGEWGTSAFKAREFPENFSFIESGVSGVPQNGKRTYFTWSHTSVILGYVILKKTGWRVEYPLLGGYVLAHTFLSNSP